MVTAEEDQDWWKYFVNFKFICFRLMPHMHPVVREGIAKDFKKMVDAIGVIRKNESNDMSKKAKVLTIQKDFVDTHQAYLFDTLPNAGLANIKADGDVDYDKLSFEQMKSVVRNQIGTKTAVDRAVAEAEGKNGDL